MNRQVGYIAYAYLLVTGIALSCIVISKIPPDTAKEEGRQENAGIIQSINTNLSENGYRGKALFQSKCASCHSLFKDMTGPGLDAALKSGRWDDRKQLYKWIRNPEGFMKTDPYTSGLLKQYGAMMTAFPTITDEEIDAIVEYVTTAMVPAIVN